MNLIRLNLIHRFPSSLIGSPTTLRVRQKAVLTIPNSNFPGMRRLWQDTYKGKDIAYIQITSDVEASSGDTVRTGAGSRSYNYRLVMILTNGSELGIS